MKERPVASPDRRWPLEMVFGGGLIPLGSDLSMSREAASTKDLEKPLTPHKLNRIAEEILSIWTSLTPGFIWSQPFVQVLFTVDAQFLPTSNENQRPLLLFLFTRGKPEKPTAQTRQRRSKGCKSTGNVLGLRREQCRWVNGAGGSAEQILGMNGMENNGSGGMGRLSW